MYFIIYVNIKIMGLNDIDFWSTGHFMMGILSGYLFRMSGYNKLTNFLITNGFHLFIEMIEKPEYNGIILESLINHVTDIILFFVGWVISFNIPDANVPFLWIILIGVAIKEVYRELFPCSTGIIKGAYVKNFV